MMYECLAFQVSYSCVLIGSVIIESQRYASDLTKKIKKNPRQSLKTVDTSALCVVPKFSRPTRTTDNDFSAFCVSR